MNNNLGALNDYLFEQLERLNDTEELREKENFEKEMERTKAITDIAKTIIANANTVLSAKRYMANTDEFDIPPMLLGDRND